MLVTSLPNLNPHSSVYQNLEHLVEMEGEAVKIGTDVTISKNLTEEYVIADLHRDVTMWEG